VPVSIVAWEDFRARFPDGKVLSRDTGFAAPYGSNPYVGYDRGQLGGAFLFKGEIDERFPAFEPQGDDTFLDRETGTTWDLLGRAIAGPLEGKQLTPAVHTNELWFAWAAFNPEAEVYAGS